MMAWGHITLAVLLLNIPGGQGKRCTDIPTGALYSEYPEDTTVGYWLFNFTMSMEGVTSLVLETNDENSEGYLTLNRIGDTDEHYIQLNKSLNLNVLNNVNPLQDPVPQTPENVDCGEEDDVERIDNRANNCGFNNVNSRILYILECTADNGQPPLRSDVTVVIEHVNDFKPRFLCSPYHKVISELTPLHTTVFILGGLGYDPDVEGGVEGYDFVGGGDGKFDMVGRKTDGYISVIGELDYDHGQRQYDLNVTVTDIGDPSLTGWVYLHLNLSDGDDQDPAFTQPIYTLSLPEEDDTIVDVPIATTPPVYGYDQDYGINTTINYTSLSVITATLTSGYAADEVFTIDGSTGEVIPHFRLDREFVSSYNILIQAYQQNSPVLRTSSAMIQVTVEDVNDNVPVMSDTSYTTTVQEHLASGSPVLTVKATDADEGVNAELAYHLIDSLGLLWIDPDTGVISVLDSDGLDREKHEQFTVQVYAQESLTVEKYESGHSDVIIKLSDINDNNPIHDNNASYYYRVKATIPQGDPVGYVTAHDADDGENGRVRYYLDVHLSPDQADQWFLVDETMGHVTAKDDLTMEEDTLVTLVVQAEDTAHRMLDRRMSTARVQVHFSDVFNPTWSLPVYTPSPATDALPSKPDVSQSTTPLPKTTPPQDNSSLTSYICVFPTSPMQLLKEDSYEYDWLVIFLGVMVVLLLLILVLLLLLYCLCRKNVKKEDKGCLTEGCTQVSFGMSESKSQLLLQGGDLKDSSTDDVYPMMHESEDMPLEGKSLKGSNLPQNRGVDDTDILLYEEADDQIARSGGDNVPLSVLFRDCREDESYQRFISTETLPTTPDSAVSALKTSSEPFSSSISLLMTDSREAGTDDMVTVPSPPGRQRPGVLLPSDNQDAHLETYHRQAASSASPFMENRLDYFDKEENSIDHGDVSLQTNVTMDNEIISERSQPADGEGVPDAGGRDYVYPAGDYVQRNSRKKSDKEMGGKQRRSDQEDGLYQMHPERQNDAACILRPKRGRSRIPEADEDDLSGIELLDSVIAEEEDSQRASAYSATDTILVDDKEIEKDGEDDTIPQSGGGEPHTLKDYNMNDLDEIEQPRYSSNDQIQSSFCNDNAEDVTEIPERYGGTSLTDDDKCFKEGKMSMMAPDVIPKFSGMTEPDIESLDFAMQNGRITMV